MLLFDSHCHLQDPRLLVTIDQVVDRARSCGVRRLLCCATSEDDWEDVSRLARRFPEVTPAFGLHPFFVTERRVGWKERLTAMLRRHPEAAVGEVGLDHLVRPRQDQEQNEVLLDTLRVARELERPVSVHCRRAWQALEDALRRVGPLPAGLVLHAYGGPVELVQPLLRHGAYFAFGGAVTRPSNRRAPEVVRAVPADRMLVETDAPDIVPHGALVRTDEEARPINEPATLPLVVRAVAGLRGDQEEEVARQTWANACRVFGGTERV